MRNRLALLVVAAAAIGLVLTGCGRGPATTPPPDDPMPPSIDGTWYFTGFAATIAVPDVTVTVGDGTTPLSMDQDSFLANVTQIMATGTLTMSGTTYKLALAEGDDAISVTLVPGVPSVFGAVAKTSIKGLIEDAQGGDVNITVSEDMMMITVKGSFLDTLSQTLGMTPPAEGLKGCKDAPCTMPS